MIESLKCKTCRLKTLKQLTSLVMLVSSQYVLCARYTAVKCVSYGLSPPAQACCLPQAHRPREQSPGHISCVSPMAPVLLTMTHSLEFRPQDRNLNFLWHLLGGISVGGGGGCLRNSGVQTALVSIPASSCGRDLRKGRAGLGCKRGTVFLGLFPFLNTSGGAYPF